MTIRAPLNFAEACKALGVGRTKLLEHIKTHPHCRRVGRRGDRRFDPEHIEALKVSLHEEARGAFPAAPIRRPTAAAGRIMTPEESLARVRELVEQLGRRRHKPRQT